MPTSKDADEAKPQTASEMGRKGGRAKGESKRRGDSAYYRSLRAKRDEAERKRKLATALELMQDQRQR